MALQNGEEKKLGTSELETGSNSKLTLVLNYETDASGNVPGCYVYTTDGLKESLNANGETINEIIISHDLEVVEDIQTDLVVDFELRKTITAEIDKSKHFSFLTEEELNEGIKNIEKSEADIIGGTCEEA